MSMTEVRTGTNVRFQALGEEILRICSERESSIVPWLSVVFPFSMVKRRPFTLSFVFGGVLLLLVVLANIPKLSVPFFISHALLAALVSIGLLASYVLARIFTDVYAILRTLVLMPADAFRRRYTREISKFFGRINTYDNQEDYTVRELLRDDKLVVFCWLGIAIAAMPGPWIASQQPLEFTVGTIAIGVLFFFYVISFTWTAHFAVYSIAFIWTIRKLPLRYFLGMPACLSLKALGRRYLQIALVYSAHTVVHFSMIYSYHVVFHPISIFFLTLVFLVLMMIVLVSQVTIALVLRQQKQRKEVEMSLHLERQFEEFLHNPTEKNQQELDRLKGCAKSLRGLDTVGFSASSFLLFLVMFFADIGLFVLWGYSALTGHWFI